MHQKFIIILFVFFCGCPQQNTNINKFTLLPNYFVSVEHTGQTQYNLEYQKIFISLDKSFIKTAKNDYEFSISKQELQNLAAILEQQKATSQNSFQKETTITIQNGDKKYQEKDSVWNLAKFITPIEKFIDTKINLPFRIPFIVPHDLVIQIQKQQNLYSETGKYIRVFNGESNISVLEETQKQLHTFTITTTDLQEFREVILNSNFYWRSDSEQYGNVVTIITWGKNKIEKKFSVDALENLIAQKANFQSFPNTNPIPQTLQIDIRYEQEGITYKDIYLSMSSCHIYTFDQNQNRRQKNFTLLDSELIKILQTIEKFEDPDEEKPVTLNITWEKSNLEKKTSLAFVKLMENLIMNILKE